jgi:hypothetical protein
MREGLWGLFLKDETYNFSEMACCTGGLALRYFSLLERKILVISFWMILGLFALRSLPGYRN